MMSPFPWIVIIYWSHRYTEEDVWKIETNNQENSNKKTKWISPARSYQRLQTISSSKFCL
jgi:hypothetical protein